MPKNEISEYVIDLCEPEAERWQEVIEAETEIADELAREALGDLEFQDSFLVRAGKFLLGGAYRHFGGLYVEEMAAWGDAICLPTQDVIALNCSYELSHLAEIYDEGGPLRIFGCTAGIRWSRRHGLIHCRNLGWPLPGMSDATRLFHFVDGGREFYSVGIPGFVGALSGMVPGAYSVTINWAPPAGRPTFDFGPAFLLRAVLQECDTYDEAVFQLKNAALSTPVFFTVCGTEQHEASVIERRRKKAAVRPILDGVLVQANHHIHQRFRDHDDYWDDAETTTWERAQVLQSALEALGQSPSMTQVAECLDLDPVFNEDTVQQMVFCPRSGELELWTT